jgi:fructokinase
MRLGIDFGGTKIEGVVLGPTAPSAPAPGCRRRATTTTAASGDPQAAAGKLEAEAAGASSRWGSACPARSTGRPARCRAATRPGSRGGAARRSQGGAGAAGQDRQRRELLRALGGGRRRRRRRRGGVRRDPRLGVGGGIVVHGRLVEGANAIAGEWGHIPLPTPRDDERPGRPAPAGCRPHRGLAVGPEPRRRLRAADRRRSREAPPAQEVIARALGGEPEAEETLRRFEDRLGRSLAVIVNVLDPDVIVLGGGLSNVPRFYETVPPRLAAHVFGGRCGRGSSQQARRQLRGARRGLALTRRRTTLARRRPRSGAESWRSFPPPAGTSRWAGGTAALRCRVSTAGLAGRRQLAPR